MTGDYPVAPVKMRWTLVEAVQSLSRPVGLTCGLFGLAALLGYYLGLEFLHRPLPDGPATHPLTALCALLLGLALRPAHKSGLYEYLFLAASAVLSLLLLLEHHFGLSLTRPFTPFLSVVEQELAEGKENSMGANTAVMFLCTAIALAMNNMGMPKASQAAASVAVAVPCVSFVGYAYGLEGFYGQMSLITATLGFGLSLSVLFLTADHGGLRALLSPYIGGRVARVQVLAGCLVPSALGYLVIKSFAANSTGTYGVFGLFVVGVCWFIILMISVSAIVVERADFSRRLGEARLAAAALHDELTGLPNRRKFFHDCEHELERSKRTGADLWVLMLDIDHFKHINDTQGHAMGDQVLKQVSQSLTLLIRGVDLIARMGGEEFAIVLVDSSREGCERVAEAARANIESLEVPDWTRLHGPITISIGAARLGPDGVLDQVLHQSDQALYYAKEEGRNRVSFYDQLPQS